MYAGVCLFGCVYLFACEIERVSVCEIKRVYVLAPSSCLRSRAHLQRDCFCANYTRANAITGATSLASKSVKFATSGKTGLKRILWKRPVMTK